MIRDSQSIIKQKTSKMYINTLPKNTTIAKDHSFYILMPGILYFTITRIKLLKR